MNTWRDSTWRYSALALPYMAVLCGLYLFQSAILSSVFYKVGMLLLLLLARYPLQKIWQGWRLGWGGLLIGLGALAGVGLQLVSGWIVGFELAPLLADLGLTKARFSYFALSFILFTPILEELFWRGWLGGEQRRIGFSDIAFAGYHLFVVAKFAPIWTLFPVFIALVLIAAVWRYVSSISGGLAIPFISHLAADVSIMFWVGAVLFANT